MLVKPPQWSAPFIWVTSGGRRNSNGFELIFLVVLIPVLIRKFTNPHLLTTMFLPRTYGALPTKGPKFHVSTSHSVLEGSVGSDGH